MAAILCHAADRVIANDYTFSFASRQFQIAREDVQTRMRRQRWRIEVRLDGELYARYQGRYLAIRQCGAAQPIPEPAVRKPPRREHNAGRKSAWMNGFFERCAPPLLMSLG